MKLILSILTTLLLASCVKKNNNRKDILGKDFTNSEVVSIDIVAIEHPILGGIVETITLSDTEKEAFLTNFDKLEEREMYKCFSKHVIRLNMAEDTLRLKACSSLMANRMNDVYYQMPDETNMIAKYLEW